MAAGAIARIVLSKLLGKKYKVIGAVVQLGILGCDKKKWNEKEIRKNQKITILDFESVAKKVNK